MARLLDGVSRWLRGAPTGQFLSSHLGAFYIRCVVATTRWEILGWDDHRAEVLKGGQGVIAAIWHGRLFLSAIWPPKDRRSVAMISNNRDGDLIAAIVRRFGVSSVRGSTFDREKMRDKGGAQAFSGALRELHGGSMVAITPDGPRGPRMRAQRGAALLSIQSGCPVLPLTFSVVRGKVTRSWDRFLIPWPFGRGVQIFGKPIWPPTGTDDANVLEFLDRIEAGLTEVTERADRMCGREPVFPGPPIEKR
ncbi:MAG: lysophospholipid acyltransferase family protein [Pseudomonadota bacterium]